MCTAGDSRVFCAGNCTCCLYMYIKVLYTCTCIFIDKFHFSLTQLPIHQQHQCMEFITGTAYTSLTLDFTPGSFFGGIRFYLSVLCFLLCLRTIPCAKPEKYNPILILAVFMCNSMWFIRVEVISATTETIQGYCSIIW
jgi:hypothetical protein